MVVVVVVALGVWRQRRRRFNNVDDGLNWTEKRIAVVVVIATVLSFARHNASIFSNVRVYFAVAKA